MIRTYYKILRWLFIRKLKRSGYKEYKTDSKNYDGDLLI